MGKVECISPPLTNGDANLTTSSAAVPLATAVASSSKCSYHELMNVDLNLAVAVVLTIAFSEKAQSLEITNFLVSLNWTIKCLSFHGIVDT